MGKFYVRAEEISYRIYEVEATDAETAEEIYFSGKPLKLYSSGEESEQLCKVFNADDVIILE